MPAYAACAYESKPKSLIVPYISYINGEANSYWISAAHPFLTHNFTAASSDLLLIDQHATRFSFEPLPVLDAKKAGAATAALSSAGTLALNRASGMMQLGIAGKGVLTTTSELAGYIAGAVWRGAVSLGVY